MIQILIMIFVTLVVLEFGVHIIYHMATGKAGLNDRPFNYLKDIWRSIHDKAVH